MHAPFIVPDWVQLGSWPPDPPKQASCGQRIVENASAKARNDARELMTCIG
jgi:hypothetical protein